MQEFMMTTYTIALPVVLGYIVWLLKEQKKVRSANSEGTKCLLRVKLIEYHDKYMGKGSIPSYALRNWVEMFNGMIDGMDREVRALKID